MQSLASLWFQLQMSQQYLREKTLGPDDPDQDRTFPEKAKRKRKLFLFLVGAGVYIAMAAFSLAIRRHCHRA